MMFDFLDSAGWAILLAIGLGWLYWARLIKNRSDVEKRPGWKMVFSCAVVAFLFGVLIALRASGGVPAVVTTWGGSVNVGGVVQCNAIIDTSRLRSFKGKYKLVLICGMQDATVDILDNKEIMVSNSFEIEPRGVGIVTENERRPEKWPKFNPGQVIRMWVMPVLLQSGISVDKINNLRDVMNLGGRIISPSYWD